METFLSSPTAQIQTREFSDKSKIYGLQIRNGYYLITFYALSLAQLQQFTLTLQQAIEAELGKEIS